MPGAVSPRARLKCSSKPVDDTPFFDEIPTMDQSVAIRPKTNNSVRSFIQKSAAPIRSKSRPHLHDFGPEQIQTLNPSRFSASTAHQRELNQFPSTTEDPKKEEAETMMNIRNPLPWFRPFSVFGG
jgi:hypothetical protein